MISCKMIVDSVIGICYVSYVVRASRKKLHTLKILSGIENQCKLIFYWVILPQLFSCVKIFMSNFKRLKILSSIFYKKSTEKQSEKLH